MKLVGEKVVQRFDLVRNKMGYSYPEMANLIGFELKGDTLRKAVKRGRLKEVFVLSLINKLDISPRWMFEGVGEMRPSKVEKKQGIFLEKNGIKISIKEIINFLDQNESLLLEIDDNYNTWLENKANEKMFKVFRENNIEYKVVVNNPTEKL